MVIDVDALRWFYEARNTGQHASTRPMRYPWYFMRGKGSELEKVAVCLKRAEALLQIFLIANKNLEELWTLHVDDSSNASGAGVGLILTGPESDILGYALCFEFLATNNGTEYEALLIGLKVVREARSQ